MKPEPRFDGDGRPVLPPTEVVFREIHQYFLEHRWSPEPLTHLEPASTARRKWGDEPWRQFLHGSCDDPRAVDTAKSNYKQEMLRRSLHSTIVNYFRLHLSCDRRACRRAHACAATDVDCYYVVHRYVRDVVYRPLRPRLIEELARRQAEREIAEAAEEASRGAAQTDSQRSAAGVNSAAAAAGAKEINPKEGIMSKGRDRPGKEKRKPKADKNKKKKGVATPPPGGVKSTVTIAVPKS